MLTKGNFTPKLLIGVLATLGFTLSAAGSALAVINSNIQTKDKSVSIVVSPANSKRLDMKPGGVYDGEFKVLSDAKHTNEVFTTLLPYTIKEDGIQDYKTETRRTSVTKWAKLEVSGCEIKERKPNGEIYFMMRPQEECVVSYHIEVPKDAVGGSQDAGIFVQSVVRNGDGGTVGRSYRYGYMIYSDVDGPGAKYEGRVVENKIPWLLFSPPLTATGKVENTGTIDFTAKYSVSIKNAITGEKAWEYPSKEDGDSNRQLVMGESSRINRIAWEGAPHLGIFEVTQTIDVLGKPVTKTQLVFIVPLWLIILVLGIVAALIVNGIYQHKKRNKRHAKRKNGLR
ncbi:MAG: hypothetical protein LBG75_01620 [Candidatus Nomurabacteria bacterium]|jgi:hypothetical protein|nr:hypothetical protein [Candidatus Nomurabacteria bacterium]